MIAALILLITSTANQGDSQACTDTFKQIANNFMSTPSLLTMLADSGKGVNDFGLYNDCNNSTTNHYIMLSVMPSANPMLNLDIGLCVPKECTKDYFDPLKEPLAKQLTIFLQTNVTVDMVQFIDNKEKNKDYSELNYKRWLAIAFLLGLLLICMFSACASGKPISVGAKIFSSFNIASNAKALLYSENKVDKNLDALNGARVLSMGWVILGHSFVMMLYSPLLNITDLFSTLTTSTTMSTVTAGTLSVDTFFCLSGFLACFGLTKQFSNPKQVTATNIIMAIVKRLIRLYPIYIAVFILGYNILPIIGNGPVYYASNLFLGNCDKTWYYNILFIDNFEKSVNMCFAWTWYIANDMQFFIVMIPLCILYNKSKAIAIWVTMILIFGSHLVTFLIIYIYKYPIFSLTDMTVVSDAFDKVYYKPWCRISTYLIGALFGWLYLASKSKSMNTKFAEKINRIWAQSHALRYLLYLIGFGVITFMVYSLTYFYKHGDAANRTLTLLYYTFSRSVFIFSLMLILYPIFIGRGKPLHAFLGHSFFNALAKMTYSVYQIHLLIYSSYFLATIQGTEYRGLFMVTKSIDIFVTSYLLGFVLTLMFESPVIQLEKYFLSNPMPKAVTNSDKDNELTTSGKSEETVPMKEINQ